MEETLVEVDEQPHAGLEGFSFGDALLMSWLDGDNHESSIEALDWLNTAAREEVILEAEPAEVALDEIVAMQVSMTATPASGSVLMFVDERVTDSETIVAAFGDL